MSYNPRATNVFHALLAITIIASSSIIYLALGNLGVQIRSPETPNILSVNGSGSIVTVPDRAIVSFAVDTDAPTAYDALQQNAQLMTQVTNTLIDYGIPSENVSTKSFTIQPVYNYPRNQPPVLIGYHVSNTVELTISNFSIIGQVVDNGVKTGANRVNGITCAVSQNRQLQLRDRAISLAVVDAQTKAQKALQPLNLRILGVQSMSVSEVTSIPPFTRLETVSATTPIFPGQQTITVSVQVGFLIGT